MKKTFTITDNAWNQGYCTRGNIGTDMQAATAKKGNTNTIVQGVSGKVQMSDGYFYDVDINSAK